MNSGLSVFSPKSRIGAAFLIAAFLLLISLLSWQYAGAAASTVVADTTGNFLRFKQSGSADDVLKITVGSNENTETLTAVAVVFVGTAGTPTWTNTAITSSELADLLTASGGIQLWKETSGAGSFSAAADTQVTLAATPVYAASNTFVISPASAPSLATDDVYYIVLKPDTAGVTNNNAFTVTIPADGIVTSVSSPTVSVVTTAPITMDTTAPTLSSAGPANNSINVPISSFIGLMFSESMDPSTLTSSNISMTAGGSPVGVAIRPGFDGVNLIVSSAPTYTASTRFAKLSTVSEAFYFMSGTNPIIPNGAYTAPTVGDIIYFAHDGFPMEVGVITTSTLTSGTFAVNGFSLFGGQRIIKAATPTATGAVTAATVVTTGDLIVINTTATPTDTRYNWHLVTTGAAVNNASLRVDGADAAPAYVSGSKFSTITPTATATDNGATGAGTLALTQGDLVFAKVGSNYGWHIATTAGDLSSADAEITAILDNGTASSSKVTASSVMSKLTPAAQGAVTDSATAFTIGNIVFAKTTANAMNNGSYAFHMVSAPATGANSSDLRFDDAFSPLTISTNYVVTVGTGVKDRAGNALASAQTVSFTTGSTGSANSTPPAVTSSSPQPGAQTHPLNAPLIVNFSVPMDNSTGGSAISSANVTLSTDNFGAPGTPITVTRTLSADLQSLTITPASALSANTNYILRVANTTKSSTGVALSQDYFLGFRTNAATDTTKPTIMGVFPANAATGVVRGLNAVCAGASEDLLGSSITASTVTLSGGISGTATYQPSSRAVCFTPSQQLAASTEYTFTVTSGATDLSGNALDQVAGGGNNNFTSTFTTGDATDSTAPTVQFAAADNNKATITFSEPMKSGGGPSAVDNAANFTLESPVGSSVSLSGKTVTYDGMTMTATIAGLSLANGNSVLFTVSNVAQDLAGNTISTTGTPAGNTSQSTVQNSATTGGNLAPGSGSNMQTGAQAGMNPTRFSPMMKAAGGTSAYMIEFPVTTSIPLGGKIVLTFPTGFDVTNAVAATAGTESFVNADMNGPSAGAVTIASVVVNASARTITVTTGGAVTGANVFLRFDLKAIVNSSMPSTTGYTGSITTKDASSVILESLTSNPFFLGTSGANALTVNVFNDNGAGGGTASNNTKDGSEAGIASVNVFLFSPQLGGQQASTNGSGVATFSNLASGDYEIGLDPSTVGNFSVNTSMQPLSISTNATKNIGLTAAPYTIGGTITGPANTSVDVFASSPNGFVVKNVTTNGGGTVAYTLPVAGSTTYNVGVGPAIPRANMVPGSPPPPPPTFTFMPPANISVAVTAASVTGKNFTLTATSGKAITGFVRDSAGTGISNANVFARPVENSTGGTATGFGAGATTGNDGSFSIPIIAGSYLVEGFKPGMPHLSAQQVTVPTTGTNTPASLIFTIGVSSTGLTISGTVTDESGNAIPYSGVSARLANSTSDTSFIGGSSDGMVGGPTDINGKYTLYVKAGTWVIEAFAPGYGRLGSKTVTITDTASTGQDFSAATISVGTITGTATKNSVAIQGVNVRAEGAAGVNMAVTDASGAYSLKVPAGSYTVTCLFQGFGEKSVTGAVAVTAGNTTSGKNCAMGAPITLTVYLTDGTAGITGAFVEARDANGFGNGTNTSVASGTVATYTLTVAPGTYTIRAGHPSYGMIGTTSAVSATSFRTYTASVGAMRAVTGTVTAGSAVEGAWASLTGTPTGQTNTIHLGALTNSSGAFSISVPDGIYSLRADKPGNQSGSETQVTVAGSAVDAGAITLTTAGKTITGTVTLSGNAVGNVWVDANNGTGGFAVGQTGTDGAYSLAVGSGNWRVNAHSNGSEGAYANLVDTTNTSVSGINISLSAISGYTAYASRPETMTPASGGKITNSDITGFQMIVPANALGSDQNAATLTTSLNSAMPNATTGKIFSKNAISITAVDSSGEPISSLNDDLQLVIPYDETELPAGSQETDLVIAYWNDATQTYNTLSTAVDSTNNTLTATVDHLSDFAPMVATDPEAPATPANFSAALLTTTSVRLVWDAVVAANSYDIYQSTTSGGTFARIGSEPTISSSSTTSYDVTGLTSGTRYYWKISSLNVSGNESAASGENYITVGAPGTTGGGGISGGGSSGGGSGASTSATITTTPAATQTATPTATQTPAQQLTALQAQLANLQGKTAGASTFLKILRLGSENSDVTALQTFLEAKGLLKMPAGVAKGYFGNATKQALMKYQKNVGLESVGELGPATRGKINAELAGTATVAAPVMTATPSGKATFSVRLRAGSEGADVSVLQTILETKGFLKMPAGVAKGYFGNATKAALAQYQTSLGLEAVGELGPATRAALNSGK